MNILIEFVKTPFLMPRPWITWMGLLMAVNILAPIFFLSALEARVVLGTMMASAIFMMFIFAQKGFVRLLGLGHFLWIPVIIWLFGRMDFEAPFSSLKQWVLAVLVLNGLSLVIDAVDVFRYLRGERAPTLTLGA